MEGQPSKEEGVDLGERRGADERNGRAGVVDQPSGESVLKGCIGGRHFKVVTSYYHLKGLLVRCLSIFQYLRKVFYDQS